jgi:LmbE family N-acetylglucosaminyl deacetylase
MKLLILLLLFPVVIAAADLSTQGAALLKTDLMFIGAHPDDETGIAATLARYAGQGKVVATIYCTRGEGGGNMVGTQAGPSLGILRERELRDCLRILGVRHVYFLDEEDFFYTESLTATLEKWNKEDILGKLVRVVRSLRPDVIITMNPAPNPGQHGHHQAAGILATEVFSAAADPARFPEQLIHEGLSVWQPRKLYYSSSAEPNVKIRTDEPLPNGDIPADLAAKALSQHRSQAFGNFGNSPWLRRPSSFVLARTAVQVSLPEIDLLDGAQNKIDPNAQSLLTRPAKESSFEFIPRPAISRFKEWSRLHQVEHTASGFLADVPVISGQPATVRLRHTSNGKSLSLNTGEQWAVRARKTRSLPENLFETTFELEPKSSSLADSELIVTESRSEAGQAKVRLHPVPLAQVSRKDPTEYSITTNLLVQGRTDSPADLSATFDLSYDKESLHVRVQISDDHVVSNIEPNDIKGHWRSDSVEICIDPNPGSEHTMRTFKLGIFPFDSSGAVRGARDADANQGPIERTVPGVKLKSERTPAGYAIQVEIPWKYIGAKPKRGLMLGFNIIVYDGDKQNAASGENINEARIAWSPRPGVQGRPEDWGRLILR